MVRTLDANQTIKIDRPYIQPIYFFHLLLSGLTLYFSDRNFFYNGQNYEDYFSDLSDIGNEIRSLGGYNNAQLTLKLKNQRIRSYNYLIELFDIYPSEKKYIECYKLMIDTGETFGSDVSTKIFKGEMGQPYDVDEIEFKIDCSSMLFGKNVALPLDVIDLADFPSADPDDVGKYRNIIYGNLKKVVCLWTVAGWVSSLVADISATQTNIEVSDAASAPYTPFTMTIDSEETTVTNKSGNNFTVTRGYYNTEHNKGVTVYEKMTTFEAEVAKHPVKSIGDVYAKRSEGEWFRVTAGVTKYTDSGGLAKLVFTDKVTFEQKVNITADTDEGTHPHDATMPTGYSIRKCIPTGASGGSNPTWAIDGNDDSYAAVSSVQALTVTFTEDDLGTINKQYVWVRNNAGSTSGTITCGGTNVGSLAATVGWQRFTKTGGDWDDNVVVPGGGGGNSIGEVYKEIEYSPTPPTVDTHAATGVWTTLSGNSVANMTIGDIVACDMEGYQDDGSGTYTGTPNALIERPDHIRKHILVALLGFVAGDIGASFATVGNIYAGRIASGYKLAFVLHEVATETLDLFEILDFQTRSNLFESGGKFELSFGSTDEPTSQITFDKDNTKGIFKFGKTEVADVRNKIRAHYFRDYSKQGALGGKYQKVSEKFNSTSLTKYGQLQEDIEFSAIGDLILMVDDVLDWILYLKMDTKRTVEFEAFWDAMILEHCDYFTITNPFWSGGKYKTLKAIERPENQVINMKGIQTTEYITTKRYPKANVAVTWTGSEYFFNYQNVGIKDPINAPLVANEPDYDGSYNRSADVAESQDTFLVDTLTIPQTAFDIFVSVTVLGKMEVDNGDPVNWILVMNSTQYATGFGAGTFGTDWEYMTEYYSDGFINPLTGLAWTPDQINGIGPYGIIGIGYAQQTLAGTNLKSISEIYITVNYKI